MLFGVASATAALGLCAGVATTAFLLDADDNPDNRLTSGSIELFGSPRQDAAAAASCSPADLAADDWRATFTLPSFGDLRPGETRATTVCLRNGGTIDGAVSVQATDVRDFENTCIDPESEAADVSCGPLQGELSDQLRFGIATYTPTGASCLATPAPQQWLTMDQLKAGTGVSALPGGAHTCVSLTVDWPMAPDAVGPLDRDRANGDSAEFDLVWTLAQVV
ncbi:hypothetical protein [Nocardioides coralli]|uniref:hypothetical protein n=1 Tax=Nocardioides coralli TaxID=2872154 RepID=UPI001CA3B11E|nr:hypothetical protein [Nocardioides coralli]QZY28761.1 hypothetical protein K6T13_15075 [Nocardioides coralli]